MSMSSMAASAEMSNTATRSAPSLRPSPWRIWTRLAWKEYRSVRAFGWSLFAFGAAFQLLGLLVGNPGLDGFSLITPILFLGGVIGTTFAREHESGSYLWVRSLPCGWGSVLSAKLFVAVTGALLLAIVFFGSTLLQMPLKRAPTAKEFLDVTLVVCELSAWAMICSLTDRQPLRALIVAGCITTAVALGFLITTENVWGSRASSGWWFSWTRLAVASVVFAVGCLLGIRWQRYGLTGASLWGFQKSARQRAITMRPQPGPVRAQVQLAWRQSRWQLLLIGVLFAWATAGGAAASFLILVGMAAISGTLAFAPMGDQRLQFACHGASPWQVWLVRIVVHAAPLLVGWVVALGWPREHAWDIGPGEMLTMLATMFCFGQLASMFARNSLLAFGVTVPSYAFSLPLFLLLWNLNIPGWLLAPFCILSLAWTWSQSAKWLLGIDEAQIRKIQVTVAAALILSPLPFIATYRVLEEPPLAESETVRIQPSPRVDMDVWAAQRQKAAELIAEPNVRSEQRRARFLQLAAEWGRPDASTCSAEDLLTMNRFESALMDYPVLDEAWPQKLQAIYQRSIDISMYPSANRQSFGVWAYLSATPDQLREMIDWIDQRPPDPQVAKANALWQADLLSRVVDLDREAIMALGFDPREVGVMQALGRIAFWERWRLERQWRRYTLEQLDAIDALQQSVQSGIPFPPASLPSHRLDSPPEVFIAMQDQAASWASLARERMVILLTLEAALHYQEHGETPRNISDLKHGALRAPYTAQPFQLVHQGGMLFLAPTPLPAARLTQFELIGIGPRSFDAGEPAEDEGMEEGGVGSFGWDAGGAGSLGAPATPFELPPLPPLETISDGPK